jgi:DNA-binding CsgD family transcriptional regulator
MVVDRLVLLQPCCPDVDDPDIHLYLRLLGKLGRASWVELVLESYGVVDRRVYSWGEIVGPWFHLVLDAGRFSAALRLGTKEAPDSYFGEIASFSLLRFLETRRLREQANLLNGALDATTSSILLFDDSGHIVYANPPAEEMMSRQAEGDLHVLRDGETPRPLFEVLFSLVAKVVDSSEQRSSWSGTLLLSDGRRLKGEILRLWIDDDDRLGVLVQLSVLGPVAEQYLGVFALEHRLSPREEEVLGLIHGGMAIPKAAVQLGISPHTVRDHIKHLYRKTGANSRAELLAMLTNTSQNLRSSV